MQNLNVVQWAFFGALTILTLGGAVGTATTRNMFHAALWLLVSLFGVGGLFVMLTAPFLAAVQVLVYIGAILILIIIAIMLTRGVMGHEDERLNQWPIALATAGIAFVVLGLILVNASNVALFPSQPVADVSIDSIKDLGFALVDSNQYAIPFILASVFLTGAMIGSIMVARDDNQ